VQRCVPYNGKEKENFTSESESETWHPRLKFHPRTSFSFARFKVLTSDTTV
jgi:hypothetical protein